MIHRTAITLLGVVLLGAVAEGHELQDNRATIVLRDKINLSLTLFINYAEALHQALAPERQFAEFLVVYSALKPEELRKELAKLTKKISG